MKVDFDGADPSVVTSCGDGLTARQRKEYYHLSQISEILPWALLTAIAAAGEMIFRERCAGCHECTDKDRTASGLIHLRGFDLAQAGTDPTAALPGPRDGPLTVPKKSFTAEQSELLRDCTGVKPGAAFEGKSFAALVQTAVDRIKRKAFTGAGMTCCAASGSPPPAAGWEPSTAARSMRSG
jgi:hypothetical protein